MAISSRTLRMFFVMVMAAIYHPARCDDFLAQNPGLQLQLASQIESLFGEGVVDSRVQAVEGRMRSMYDALPKDQKGRLGQQAVRYALRRYFSRYHGWRIADLKNTNATSEGSNQVLSLDGQMPDALKDMIHGHIDQLGFALRDLASLAVMVEIIVKMEVVERLQHAYERVGRETTDVLTHDYVQRVVNQNYIIQLLAGEGVPMDDLDKYVMFMSEIYSGWQSTMVFLNDMRQSVEFGNRHKTNPFRPPSYNFEDMVDLVQVIDDKFGQFQNFECRQLKDSLLEREYHNSGRIRLQDFYALALGGEGHFSEKAEYLRELGALDDTNSVIITNYLHSQANCLGSSHFYSICCLDECEDLLGHLEEHFGAPHATTEDILAAVSRLASSTVAAPRNISQKLVNRLEEVAAFHGSQVPLHGRLFAQWMHHAYPRECSYPHAAGTTVQEGATEWAMRKAREEGVPAEEFMTVLTEQEMQLYVSTAGGETVKHSHLDEFGDHHHDAPHLYAWVEPTSWSDEEELFAGRGHLPPWAQMQHGAGVAARIVAMVLAVGAVLVQLAHGLRVAPGAAGGGYGQKGSVGMEKLIV